MVFQHRLGDGAAVCAPEYRDQELFIPQRITDTSKGSQQLSRCESSADTLHLVEVTFLGTKLFVGFNAGRRLRVRVYFRFVFVHRETP